MKDLKIVNGVVPDFENDRFVEADLLVHKGMIEQVGAVRCDACEVIDARGKIVAPGFINIHAHEDSPRYFPFTSERELLMGVTTEIAGNCGSSEPLEAFRDRLDAAGAPTNYMMFVGQNSLREQMGIKDIYQKTDRATLDKMKKELARLRKEVSPVGLSCGFEYVPGITAEETVELLSALEEEGYLTSVHLREDKEGTVRSIHEVIDISRASGYPAQLSHIGSCAAYGYMREALAALDKGRSEGVDIMSDCYPYDAFCTILGSAVFDEKQMQKRPYETIMLAMGENAGRRCDKTLFEYERREHPDQGAVCFDMNIEEVYEAFRHPMVMVGSDGGFMQGIGHPRGAGTFPKVLGSLAMDLEIISLMDALKKMTVMPAERVKLRTKGQIKEGFDADLVIFDPNTIRDRADYDLASCTLPPEGISRILIGGKTAVLENQVLNGSLGKYIRHNKA